MYVFYMDDSSEQHHYGFCALGVPADSWLQTFQAIKDWRRSLSQSDGILINREMHATDFVAGRGRISKQPIPKGRRCAIFRETLTFLSGLETSILLPAIMNNEEWVYERLLTRINNTMAAKGTQAIIISDEGKEGHYTKLARRISVHNPIASRYGAWPGGRVFRNMPTDCIIEDPVFRDSSKSFFLQMADFCAFALLRFMLGVPDAKKKYGIHTAFTLLEPICFKAANPRNPHGLGIIGQP